MSPLQRIAMGLIIVFVPATFQVGGRAWDALPDPLGWLLVLAGVRALTEIPGIEPVRWLAVAALAFSVPLWFPQVVDLLPQVSGDEGGVEPSVQWALFLPQALFSLLLARAISLEAGRRTPRDVFVGGRFGVLIWAFAATIALPPIAYGARVDALVDPTLILIALVNLVFVYYLFRVHRRPWLGGPGALEVRPKPGGGVTMRNAGDDEGRLPD